MNALVVQFMTVRGICPYRYLHPASSQHAKTPRGLLAWLQMSKKKGVKTTRFANETWIESQLYHPMTVGVFAKVTRGACHVLQWVEHACLSMQEILN